MKKILYFILIIFNICFVCNNRLYIINESDVYYSSLIPELETSEHSELNNIIETDYTLSLTDSIYNYSIDTYIDILNNNINDNNVILSYSNSSFISDDNYDPFYSYYKFDLNININEDNYVVSNIKLRRNNIITVPYNIRSKDSIDEYLFNLISDDKKSTITSHILSDYDANFDSENYDNYVNSYQYILSDGNESTHYYIVILREEKLLTDFNIIYDSSNVYTLGDSVSNFYINPDPSDAIYESVTWESSDTNVATIDSNGKLTMLSPGNVTITAYYEKSDIEKSVNLVIVNPSSGKLISINNDFLFDNGNLYKNTGKNEINLKFYRGGISKIHNENSNNVFTLSKNKELFYNDKYIDNDVDDFIIIDYHTIYYLKDNSIYKCIGNYNNISTFTVSEIINNVKSIWSNHDQSVKSYNYDSYYLVDINDNLYVWGYNIFGEKFDTNSYISSPKLLLENVSWYNEHYAILNNNDLYYWGEDILNSTKIDSNVSKVFKSNYNYVYYEKNNSLYYNSIDIVNKSLETSITSLNLNDIKEVYDNYYITDSDELYYSNSYKFTNAIFVSDNVQSVYSVYYGGSKINIYLTTDNKVYEIFIDTKYNDGESYKVIYTNKLADNICSIYNNYYGNNYWFNTCDNDVLYYDSNSTYLTSLKFNDLNDEISVKSVNIYGKTKREISVGDTLDILGIVLPYNATNKNVTWKSSNTNVATISENGKLTAISVGTTTVTLTSIDGNYTSSMDIIIRQRPTGINIVNDEKEFYIYSGNRNIGNVYAKLVGENLVDKKINWSSSDTSIINIDSTYSEYSSNEYDGYASLLLYDKTGDVTITASTSDGNYSDTFILHVIENLESISLPSESINITLGQTYQINPIVSPNTFDTSYLRYSIENYYSTYASVSSNGLITALKTGTIYVNVTSIAKNYINSYDYDENKTTKLKVIIYSKSVILNQKLNNKYFSTTSDFTNRGTIYANHLNSEEKLTWKSSDESILKFADSENYNIDNGNNYKDILIGNKEGSVTITVSNKSGVTDSIVLNVVKVLYSSSQITLDDENNTYEIKPLELNVDLNSNDFNYISSNENIVTVSSDGIINAVNVGETNVKVYVGIYSTVNNNTSFTIPVKVVKSDSNPVTSITLEKSNYNLYVNDTENINVSVVPSNATNKKLTYSSSDSNIASVDSNGKITANKSGIAIITITSNSGVKSYCYVKVLNKINSNVSNAKLIVNDGAMSGDTIVFNVIPNNEYKINNIKIIDDNNNEISYSNNSFVMPEGNVTIYVYTLLSVFKTPSLFIFDGNNNSLKLTWDKQDAEKYLIYRSTSKTKGYKLIKEVNTNEYIDSSLTYGTTYYYKVRAYKNSKYTDYSNIVSKKVIPNKVSNLKFISSGSNNIRMSWDKVSTTGYEIYRSTSLNGKYTKISTISKNSTLNYNNTKLSSNKNYYYKVRAYKTVKGKKVYGNFSNIVNMITSPAKSSISISNVEYNSLNIKIKKISGAVSYEIYRSTSKNGKYEKINTINTYGNYIDNSLITGKTYYYKVRSCNVNGSCGSYSSIVSKKVIPNSGSFTLTSTESKKVSISINSVNGVNGYEIYRSTSKNGKYTKVYTLNDLNNLIYINNTSKNKTYYYKVRSYTLVNNKRVYSNYSSIKKVKSK